MNHREEEAESGADGEGGKKASRAGLLAHGEEFHQLGPQSFALGMGVGWLRFAVKLFPEGVNPQPHQGAAENHP